MGLFDFLKHKSEPERKISAATGDRPGCDITKTQVMVDLFKIPQGQRDDNWTQAFCANVLKASYACGDPQVFKGPDGFPYFVLRTPEPNRPFESFCISNMKDDFLLDKGYGVVINPAENSVDWVFSYGDIVNLHLNNEFFSKKDSVEIKNEDTLQEGEKLLFAQPSESFFPTHARRHLKSFLQGIGIKRPKMALVWRTINEQVIEELAFNIFREDFPAIEQLNYRLQQISWFLPRHYVILAPPKTREFTSKLADL